MGLFDFFLSEEKKIQKYQRTVTNRDAQDEDRDAASRWLAENGSPKALVALLTRFEMKPMTNQMHDLAEREFVFGMLAKIGEPVVRPLKRHLRRYKKVGMPLRLLEEILGEKAAIEYIFEVLDSELERDDLANPEKKTSMLVWLAEKKHELAIEKITPFLDNFDENVRYAALEVLVYQGDDVIKPFLEARLHTPEEESNRVKVRVCEIFIEKGWTLDNPEGLLLPKSFVVNGDRLQQA